MMDISNTPCIMDIFHNNLLVMINGCYFQIQDLNPQSPLFQTDVYKYMDDINVYNPNVGFELKFLR